MAGESPDKVEREKSSGEATETADERATAGPAGDAPDRENDRPGETAGSRAADRTADEGEHGDDRLKAAVAAWVASTSEEGADEPEGAGDADSGPEDAGDADNAGDADSGAAEGAARHDEGTTGEHSGQSVPSDLPVRPKSRGGSDSASGTGTGQSGREADQPTAMFGVLRPEEGEDSSASPGDEGTSGEAAARRAERMTAAFFGSAKPGAADSGADAGDGADAGTATGDAEGAEATEAGGATEAGEGATESGGVGTAEADQPTTVVRMPGRPDKSRNSGGEQKKGTSPGADGGSAEDAAGPGGDQATAVFRTVGPAGGGKASGTGKTEAGKTEAGKAASRATGGERADDEAAGGKEANPRLPHGKDAEETGSGTSDAGSDRTQMLGVVPSARGTGKPASGRGDGAKSDGPKTDDPEDNNSEGDAPQHEESRPAGSMSADDRESGGGTTSRDGGTAKGGEAASEEDTDSQAGPAAASAPEPASEPEAGPESESESERTSQFVPLRSDEDLPKPKKPAPAVPPEPAGSARASAQPGAADAAAGAAGGGAARDGTLPPEVSEAELTRQQPRPDQAPLDLLAQLTNTPPPQETPLRTVVRRVKIWTPLVLLLAVLFVIAQAVRPLPDPELALTTSPTYTFEGGRPDVPWPSEGQAVLDVEGLGSFGSSGQEKPVPIASVAKVMTAYVILRDHPVEEGEDGELIPVDKTAEEEAGLSAQNESTVEVKAGDKITQREAVDAIMIASANNVARLLARWDAGSLDAFVKKMNEAAKDLGMKNTTYTDPSGLTATTVSTAADQVKLAKKAMDIKLFRDTVRLPGYTDAKGEKHGNWNKLVPLDGVVGIKTGTTTKAGGNLLFAAEKNIGGTRQLIVGAVLGQYRPSILDTVLAESKKLIDTAQDELEAKKVVRKGDVVGHVDDNMGGETPVVATEDVTAVGWSGLKVKLALTDDGKTVPHEATKGTAVGTLTVGDGPGQVKVPVALQADVSEPGFGAKLTRIL